VDEIHPEMLEALEIVGLSWLTRLFSRVPVRPGWWSPFSKKGTRGFAPIIGGITLLSLRGYIYSRVL